MAQMIGADVEELHQLADFFRSRADQISHLEANLAGRIHSAPWTGYDVDQFKYLWDRTYRSNLQSAANELYSASRTLHQQADEQTTASSGDGGSGGSTSLSGNGGTSTGPQVCRAPEAILEDLQDVLGGSDAEQLAWWNSLTEAERSLMLGEYPGLLLQLDGLTDADRTTALGAFEDYTRDHTLVASDSYGFDITASAGWVRIGVDGEAQMQQMGDGSYQVVLTGGASLGIGAKTEGAGASLALSGEGSVTYTFDSKADADQFVNDLVTAAVPESFGDGLSLAGNPTGYVVNKYADVFASYSDHYVTTELTGSLEGNASVSAGGASVSVSGSAGVTYDTSSGGLTYAVDYSAGARGVGDGMAATIDASGSYELSVDSDGNMTGLSISQTGGSAVGVGAGTLSNGITTVSGIDSTVTTDVDLRNPVNQQLAGDYLQAVALGDGNAANNALAQLQQNSTVTVRSDITHTDHAGFDVWAVKGNFDHEMEGLDYLYVKPPGETEFSEVRF